MTTNHDPRWTWLEPPSGGLARMRRRLTTRRRLDARAWTGSMLATAAGLLIAMVFYTPLRDWQTANQTAAALEQVLAAPVPTVLVTGGASLEQTIKTDNTRFYLVATYVQPTESP